MQKGHLYLIPSFLHPEGENDIFPPMNLLIIERLTCFIVENLRTARRMLRKIGYTKDFKDVTFFELNKHTDPAELPEFLAPALSGQDTGLLSEAGTPCIADPGAKIVALAHQQNIRVVPLTGPSSIILALMASGFNGQNFAFHGYLPIDAKERSQKIRELEKVSLHYDQTQIFIETPYRNNQMLDALVKNCQPSTLLSIACELTHPERELIRTATINQWKTIKIEFQKKPSVFLIYAGDQ